MRSWRYTKSLALLFFLCVVPLTAKAQSGSTPPIATGVSPNCVNINVCTYTDTNVAPGQHFYFIEAQYISGSQLISAPSISVNVTVPAGGHNVLLQWAPSVSGPPGISYLVFKGDPPTGLH